MWLYLYLSERFMTSSENMIGNYFFLNFHFTIEAPQAELFSESYMYYILDKFLAFKSPPHYLQDSLETKTKL